MAARRPQPVRSLSRAASTNLKDPTVSRAVDEVRAAAQSALDRREFITVTQDLAIGTNVVRHGLGRTPTHVSIMKTAAGADWYVNTNNPHSDLQVLIVVSGAALPKAGIHLS